MYLALTGCSQVFRRARLWDRLQKSVRRGIHLPGRPHAPRLRYRRNGDAKLLAYTAERITAKASLKTEFAAVTEVALDAGTIVTVLCATRYAAWTSSRLRWKDLPCGWAN
jgi:hypothetical protein